MELHAQVLDRDSGAYADAQANLEDAGALDENTGMAALDISFRNADGDEVEPDPAAGPVYVRLDARALIPDGVDESTVAVQHHAETTDGGLFGTGIFAGTEVEVETVADSSGELGEISLTSSVMPATLNLLPAEETQDETPAALDVEARFSVESFSTFTITWNGNKNRPNETPFSVTNYLWDDGITNTQLGWQFRPDNLILGTGNELSFDAENPKLAIDGYRLVRADLEYTTYSYSRWSGRWTPEEHSKVDIQSFTATYDWNSSWTYSFIDADGSSENIPWRASASSGWNTEYRYTTISFTLYYEEVAPEATGALYITDTIAADGTLTAQFDPEQWTGEGVAPDLSSGDYYYRWYRQAPESSTFELVEGELGASIPVYYDGAQATYRVELWRSGEDQATDVSFNYQVPYYDQLQNGSFEDVKVPSGSNLQFTSGLYPEMVWQTTGLGSLNTNKGTDGQDIEIINADQGESNYGEDQAAAGEQYAELNCEWPGALYQDVLTVPNEELYWWAAHQARYSGWDTYDTMYVVIMDASQAEQHVTSQDDIDVILDAARNRNIDALDEYNDQPTYPDSGTEVTVRLDGVQVTATVWRVRSNAEGWHHYADQYQVPDGQYLTRFFFAAGNEDEVASGDITVGNLIDDVGFNQYGRQPDPEAAALTIQKTVRGLDPGTTVPADSFTFTVTGQGGEAITVSLPETEREVPANGVLTVTDAVTGLTANDYTVSETHHADSLSGYQYTGTTVNDKEGTDTSIVLNPGESEQVRFVNTYEKNTASLTIVKDIYGLNREQVVDLIDGTYRQINPATENESGLRFDVDYFSTQDGAESDNYNDKDVFVGDWTFNASDTLDPDSGNFTSGGTWDGDIHIPEDEMIQQDEAAHYGSSSLTEKTATNGETYYQYTIIISDLELDDWYHVWETHVNVPGYQLTSDVETDAATTGTSQGHADFAAVLQLTGDTTVTFTNRYSQGQLDLTKNVTVSGQTDNTGTTAFEFEIRIPAKWADPAEYNTGKYPVTYTRVDESTVVHPNGDVTFVLESGTDYAKATIQLYAGETAHIKLPTGIDVIVTEPNHDGYSVNWTIDGQNLVNITGEENSAKVSIPVGDEKAVICTNTTGAVLPSTGGPGVANIMTLGTLLTLGAGALLLLQRRRKEGDAC